MRVKHHNGIDLWHLDCARGYFAAMVDPPVRVTPDSVGADRSCRWCDGPLDGSEQLCAVDGQLVWLHPECQGHYVGRLGG
jgi:hypothetical protein